jgi:hypothetical protein
MALSSIKSEYMALFQASIETIWGKKLLVSLGQKKIKMVVIHSNNQSIIAFIENLKFHL